MALDATVGGANANTYQLEPSATLRVPTLVSPDVLALWTAATVLVRENALAKTALMLNSLEGRYIGLRSTPETQALCWPRTGALTSYSRMLGISEFPRELLDAQVLYAAMDVATEIDITGIDDVGGVIAESAGPVSATYQPSGRARGLARVPGVLILLQPLLNPVSAGAMRL